MAAGRARAVDTKFKSYVELMVTQEKFRPAEGSDYRWHVESDDGSETYTTTVSKKSVFCTCKGHNVAKGNECKHIRLIRLITGILGFSSTKKSIIEEIVGTRCPGCKKANYHEQAVRDTTRKGDVQRYMCNECGCSFSEGQEFGPTWYSPQMIIESLSMYMRGMSTRQIRDHWRDTRKTGDEKYPSHAIVSIWVKKYMTMISAYVAKFTPDVTDIWSTDELYILVKKTMLYLYTFMDHGTRWLLSAGIADTKHTANIAPVARDAKKAADKVPEVELRDGAANLNKAIRIAHIDRKGGKRRITQQVLAHINGNPTNRRHERVNRTIAERLRIPRFIKSKDSKLVLAFVAFYNCIRRHMALDGKTPAEAAGIIIQGANPWATLIKNAYWSS